ncbi:hypothetical protein D3C87_1518650 [compost metagenome]
MANDVENAAGLEARGLLFVDEVNRNLNGDLAVLGDAQEVNVHGEVADRIQLVVLRQDADLFAVDVDDRNGGHETAGVDLHRHVLGGQRDRKRGLLVTVDDSRDKTVATKFTGGPLTNPFARLGLELISCVAHG